MTFILRIIGSFGCFVMVKEKGIVGMGEDYILPKKRGLDELVIRIYLFKDIIIPMHESKLTIALATRFIIEIQGVLSHQHIVASELVKKLADVLEVTLRYFILGL